MEKFLSRKVYKIVIFICLLLVSILWGISPLNVGFQTSLLFPYRKLYAVKAAALRALSWFPIVLHSDFIKQPLLGLICNFWTIQKPAWSVSLLIIRLGGMTRSKRNFLFCFLFSLYWNGLLKDGICWTGAKSTLRPYIYNGFVMKNGIWLMDPCNC